MPTEQVTQVGQETPNGRPAQPAELAPVYVFLASAEASYVAGEVVGVTGASLSCSPSPEELSQTSIAAYLKQQIEASRLFLVVASDTVEDRTAILGERNMQREYAIQAGVPHKCGFGDAIS
jgi:hypothetical protein